MLLCGLGCQPTPEVPPIVNQRQGLAQEFSIDPLPEGELKPIDAPKHWKETIVLRGGGLVINADVDIHVPKISNTPVIELKQMEFTDERLRELTQYFVGDSAMYEVPKLTRRSWKRRLKRSRTFRNGMGALGCQQHCIIATQRSFWRKHRARYCERIQMSHLLFRYRIMRII